jgi:hypothetical protein
VRLLDNLPSREIDLSNMVAFGSVSNLSSIISLMESESNQSTSASQTMKSSTNIFEETFDDMNDSC